MEESKKEESTTKIVAYQHSDHLEKQQSSSKEFQQTDYGPTWNQKGNDYSDTWRTKGNAWR